MLNKNQILFIDLENSPNIGYTWNKWETDVIEFIEHWKILSVAYKWHGGKTKVIALPDFKGNERKLLLCVWKLLDEAEIVVAQNGDAFDIKKLNTRFLQHGITPPSPFKTVDTLKVAKAKFAFNSNKLDDIGKDLDEGRKVKHRGFDMWRGCMAGNRRDWADMKRYNKQDVDLLFRIYNRFLPWIKMPVMVHDDNSCPKCGSSNIHRSGYVKTMTSRYRRLKCNDCGGWSQSRVGEKISTTVPL